MSEYPDIPPEETRRVAFVLEGRARDLGGFTVRRVLPAPRRRTVGPFVFFDHMGPFTSSPERGVAVRPHPHIGLATLTYLFEGELTHRDSLGSHQVIVPGDVNWMTAGRGIVHSERMDEAAQKRGVRMHGLQCWIGLPKRDEEGEPSFAHHAADAIPTALVSGVKLRVAVGSAYGVTSPVRVTSPTLLVDVRLGAGRQVELPPADAHDEMAAYVVDGAVTCDGVSWRGGTMLGFRKGERPSLSADGESRVVLIGGAPLDGERHLFWNFVSSDTERIEKAKRDWKEGRFPKVPGDEVEFIPLPS